VTRETDDLIDLTDAILLLTWAFLGGDAHALGLECTAISGCPDVCPEG
jgi:hypothetical protein